jgi:hypothetical protein
MTNSSTTKQTKVLDLLFAVALGDATQEDVVTALRDEGVESVAALIAAFREAAKVYKTDFAPSLISLERLSSKLPSPPEPAAHIVHPIPKLPFLLNGTLYDPKDIQRFNGRELHLSPAARHDYILAVDDGDVMIKWWQLLYLQTVTLHNPLEQYQYGDYQFGIEPQNTGIGGPIVIITPPKTPSPVSMFWEDMNFDGEGFVLHANRGYANLKKKGRGFLGLGDWNDVISSVQMQGTHVCILHEHINWAGSTLTLFSSEPYLARSGWNDRASSVETW